MIPNSYFKDKERSGHKEVSSVGEIPLPGSVGSSCNFSPLEVSLVCWLFVVLVEMTLWSLGCLPALLAMGYTSALSQGLRRSWILARDGLWPERQLNSNGLLGSSLAFTCPCHKAINVNCTRLCQTCAGHEPCQALEPKQGGPAQYANSSGREAGELLSITSSDGCKLKSVFFVRNWNEGSAYKFLQL